MKASHAAVKSFDRRGVSCKNARTVQFSGDVEKCPVTQKTMALSCTIFEIKRDCFPKDWMSLWRGGNLPFGDLVGKGEPAQGSSNGLRTIHALN